MTDITPRFLAVLVIILALLVSALLIVAIDRREREAVPQAVDTLAVIQRVLDGAKTSDRLIDRWPEAARVMLEIANHEGIDALLLPCIARAEGMSETMHRAKNPFGMEVRGKLVRYCDYYYSTAAAAKLLKRNEHRWRTDDGVDVRALAEWWCPANAEWWARTVGRIYQEAWKLQHERKKQ